MEFPKWWWKFPLAFRYWACVVWAWLALLGNYLLIPVVMVLSSFVWLKDELPNMIIYTWEEHWERLRIYKLLRDKQKDKKNPTDTITLTQEEITGKKDEDNLAH